jgi:uncharacterized membrane protein
MPSTPSSRRAAQQRADRICAFRDELAALRADGVEVFSAEQEHQIAKHHDAVLAQLTSRFDVDITDTAGRLSRGMQIASFFGALTLTAAVYSLVARFWGQLDLPMQIGLLTLFPMLALAGVDIAARREPSLYVASIFAVAAYGTFWLAASVITRLLDLPWTVPVLWLGVAFGLSLAIPYGFRLVLVAALGALIAALAGTLFSIAGAPWTLAMERLEPAMIASFGLLLVVPGLEGASPGFGVVTRRVALGVGLGGLLAMSLGGEFSVLPLSAQLIAGLYQGLMLLVSTAAIIVGIRRRMRDVANLASVALALFLVSRYVDWFWSVMPRYLFFLVLTLTAFGWLFALRRLRARTGRFS